MSLWTENASVRRSNERKFPFKGRSKVMPVIYPRLKQLHSRHLIPVIVVCSLFITGVAQSQDIPDDPSLSLPNLEDVERVTIEPGRKSPYTPESLLKLLPRFVATEGRYRKPKFPQRGTIVLKNGVVLRWIALDNYSIQLQGERRVRLFVVPAECSLTAPEKNIPLRPPDGRVFHHSGRISISYSSSGSAVGLGYMELEDKLDRPNAPAFSAEFKCVNGRASNIVSFELWSTRRLKGQPLALLADGRLLKQTILRRPTDASLEDLGLVVYTINLPRRLFLKLIDAKTVKLRAGRKTFTLSADHLEALRDLASRMER
jgi:hypothetical protein